jgi:hypothetical protein
MIACRISLRRVLHRFHQAGEAEPNNWVDL